MNKLIEKTWYKPRRSVWFITLAAITIAVSGSLMMSCSSDSSSKKKEEAAEVIDDDILIVQGTRLNCDTGTTVSDTAILEVEAPDSIPDKTVSRDLVAESHLKPNAGNKLRRMSAIVPAREAGGAIALDEDSLEYEAHPLLVGYAEQVEGEYELGDGSADIGDPDQLDDMFVSLSLDNGDTWKKFQVGDTAKSGSKSVQWSGSNIIYGGHSHKPTMEVHGNNILVAWLDKYCPSGNPFGLEPLDPLDPLDPEADLYKVNGSQGSIDYGGIVAPNGKMLYEVPFSCVWTARGVLVEDPADDALDGDYIIQWRKEQQMTSGTRDANKIWIATADVGFAITWQEDPEGLRSGKGLGPGEGYSGATTNHGADIWYSYIPMAAFDDVCTTDECDAEADPDAVTDDPVVIAGLDTKPKPAVNYAYPVRISNNAACTTEDTKLYCSLHCDTTITLETGNNSGGTIDRCIDTDPDYMVANSTVAVEPAVLDGDTGASRPALRILRTELDEYVAILAYEETKGLSESDPQDQGDTDLDIALEGKSVYFESFFWDQPVEVSSGRIVNPFVPEVTMTMDDSNNITSITPTGFDIYENARRVVIISQVDSCEFGEGDYTFGLMYKQGFDTQGGSSDMYVRMNTGFTYEEFEDTVANVSARESVYDAEGKVVSISWTEENLLDQSYDNPLENTFSPRAFLRGGDLYTGFEYSPNWRQTSVGTTPNNFWMHSYLDGAWSGPKQISFVKGERVSTLDPGFFPTPAGSDTSLESDKSNSNILFLSYGTFDMESGHELDLFYSRSTDRGLNWEFQDGAGNTVVIPGINDIDGDADDAYRHAKLAGIGEPVEEKEVQSLPTPDGSILFNAYLRESPEAYLGNVGDGLESMFGRVDYNFDPAAAE